MYQWIVFIHIASVLGLLLVHPVTVAFHLKEERNDTRIRELLEVSEAASLLRLAFFGLTLASGVLLGFMGSWWAGAWIWAALVTFVERLLKQFRPWILAVTGTGGLLLILYLMLFKPGV
jgi:hypothetical protein